MQEVSRGMNCVGTWFDSVLLAELQTAVDSTRATRLDLVTVVVPQLTKALGLRQCRL